MSKATNVSLIPVLSVDANVISDVVWPYGLILLQGNVPMHANDDTWFEARQNDSALKSETNSLSPAGGGI